ncbi:MAG: hypothetical protein CMM23_09755 [Rhodospirillaceae bacterium]|nr:hypothetical protein [Rhodospirillaceae bacterium]
MTDRKPLSGVKVFDATQGVAGPHATLLLAQHGANVIKVEPLEGDWGRSLGKVYGDLCAHAVTFNRGKRSIALDLKTDAGRAVAGTLASDSDIAPKMLLLYTELPSLVSSLDNLRLAINKGNSTLFSQGMTFSRTPVRESGNP